jgi:Co/Zn/Cd efflux system component
VSIAYGEAVSIAALSLAVNLASAWPLRGEHDHHHGHQDNHRHIDGYHGPDRDKGEHGSSARVAGAARDLNLRAAYVG